MTDTGSKKKIQERIEIIVDDAKDTIKTAYRESGADNFGDTIKDALHGALSARDTVVMVRLNKESLARVEELVESGVVNSKSEAVAFLVSEGIKAKSNLFDKIGEKIETIRQAKQELKDLLNVTPASGSVGDKGETGPDDSKT